MRSMIVFSGKLCEKLCGNEKLRNFVASNVRKNDGLAKHVDVSIYKHLITTALADYSVHLGT